MNAARLIPESAERRLHCRILSFCAACCEVHMGLTQEYVKKFLYYSPSDGRLVWKSRASCDFKVPGQAENWNDRFALNSATREYSSRLGYKRCIVGMPDGKDYLAHRLIWIYMTGEDARGPIDHINRDATDNRWENLRVVTSSDNARNASLFCTNKVGFTGVNWRPCRRRWRAQTNIDGKHVHIGYYHTLIDAVAARIRANREYGFSEDHGRPKPE